MVLEGGAIVCAGVGGGGSGCDVCRCGEEGVIPPWLHGLHI